VQSSIRVVLAEDNDDLRMIMPMLINEAPTLQCLGATAFLEEVESLIAQHDAQVAVLDIELRGGSSLKHLPALRERFPQTRFIIHSGPSNPELIRGSGADAYVLKSGDVDELIRTIEAVVARG
jgi:two-component system capsular synthesis response regulator RcsB